MTGHKYNKHYTFKYALVGDLQVLADTWTRISELGFIRLHSTLVSTFTPVRNVIHCKYSTQVTSNNAISNEKISQLLKKLSRLLFEFSVIPQVPAMQPTMVAVITYKTRSTSKPAYLSDLRQDYRPVRTLRSSDKLLLSVPRMALAFSAKAFSVSAPSVWNSLSYQCRSAELFISFRHILKTELFDIACSECKQSA